MKSEPWVIAKGSKNALYDGPPRPSLPFDGLGGPSHLPLIFFVSQPEELVMLSQTSAKPHNNLCRVIACAVVFLLIPGMVEARPVYVQKKGAEVRSGHISAQSR